MKYEETFKLLDIYENAIEIAYVGSVTLRSRQWEKRHECLHARNFQMHLGGDDRQA